MFKPTISVITVLAVCLLSLAAVPRAVCTQDEAVAGPLKDAAFMLGTWKGTGWMQMGPGPREEVNVTEVVRAKVGGHAMLIDGLGTRPVEAQAEPEVVHEAMAVLWVDQQTGKLRFQSWLHDGRTGVFDAEVSDGTLIWHMELPQQQRIRYTLRINEEGQWFEIGEHSPDGGGTWRQFFEMTLNRVTTVEDAQSRGNAS